MIAPLGWVPVIQFDGSMLDRHIDMLAAITVPWVLDHYGKVLGGIDATHIDGIRRLMDGPCVLKFAAHYEASTTGAPAYDDIAALARAALDHRPDRVIWGSNWPHLLNGPDDKPDDTALLATVMDWIPERHRQAVFVETPTTLFGSGSQGASR